MADDPEKLYTIEELIAWLESPYQHWTGKRPLLYAEGAHKQMKRAQQRLHLTATAACGLGVLIGLVIGWFWFGA